MGKQLGMPEAEEPFAAALLQDMAIPLLAKEVPDAYIRLLEARQEGRVRLSELEKNAFGWTHAEAAGIIARHWNLPEAFAVLIENHLDIGFWIARARTEPGSAAVALSALLPSTKDATWVECQQFERHYESVCPAGGPTVAEMLTQTDQDYAAFAPVLKLSTPAKSLLDCYTEVATSAT
jgi:HD-like signal output (HDOD) protein